MQLLLCGPCIPMQFVFTVAKPNSFIYEAISAPAAIIKNSSPDGLHWRRSQYWVCVCPKAPSLCLGPLWLRSAIFLLNSEIRCTQLKNTYWCFLTSSGDLTMRGWDHFWCPFSMSLKYSLLFFFFASQWHLVMRTDFLLCYCFTHWGIFWALHFKIPKRRYFTLLPFQIWRRTEETLWLFAKG